MLKVHRRRLSAELQLTRASEISKLIHHRQTKQCSTRLELAHSEDAQNGKKSIFCRKGRASMGLQARFLALLPTLLRHFWAMQSLASKLYDAKKGGPFGTVALKKDHPIGKARSTLLCPCQRITPRPLCSRGHHSRCVQFGKAPLEDWTTWKNHPLVSKHVIGWSNISPNEPIPCSEVSGAWRVQSRRSLFIALTHCARQDWCLNRDINNPTWQERRG